MNSYLNVEKNPTREDTVNAKCRILYVINALNLGGAELGLQTLIDNGLFNDCQLDILLLHKADDALQQSLQNHPKVNHIYLADDNRRLTVKGMLKSMYLLSRYLRNQPCDLIIASLAQANIITLLVARFFPKVKIVSFFHNTAYSKGLYEKLVRCLSGRINACFYDNAKTFDAVSKRLTHIDPSKWFCLPLFICQESVQKSDYQLSSPIRIFSVGRLNSQKNYTSAIKAMQKLIAGGRSIEYFIAGEGEERENLQRLIDAHELTEFVHLLGFKTDWEAFARSMDLYLLASTREGLSIATLEAMSYGIPVVATQVGGIPQYGQHLNNMVIMQNSDPDSLYQGITQALDSEEFRRKIGNAGRQTAALLFGQSAVNKDYQKVIQTVFQRV